MIYGMLVYTSGEGHALVDTDRLADDVVALDILQDWIADLQAMYDDTHAIVFPDTTDTTE